MAKRVPEEVGYTGLNYSLDGTINEEFLRQLQWPDAGEVYQEMGSNDPTVGAMLFAIEMLLRGLFWGTEPASDSPRHKKEAELLESIMHDMEKPWDDTVVDILSFLQYGFSIFEPVFKIRRGPEQKSPKFRSKHSDAKWGLRKLAGRSQASIYRWVIDPDTDEVLGVEQWASNKAKRVTIPRERYLHFRVNSKRDNPESTSILRNAYRPWYFKKLIEENEATGVARDLAGIPVITAPMSVMSQDASPEEKAFCEDLKKIGTRIANDEQACILYPAVFDENGNKLVSVDLLNNNSRRLFDTDKIITRYDRQIAQTVLADFIMLGQTTFGSFALSSNKTKLFASALGAWIKQILGVLNTELVPRLAKLNKWDMKNLPKIITGDLEGRDLDTLASYFSSLTGQGLITPDDKLEEFLRESATAPKADTATARKPQSENNVTTDATDRGKPTGDAIA